MAARSVSGIVLATTSDFDTAVGRLYPLGVGVAKQVVFALSELPNYGAIGAFGIQGPETDPTPIDMLPLNQSYSFAAAHIYNINANDYIRSGTGRLQRSQRHRAS